MTINSRAKTIRDVLRLEKSDMARLLKMTPSTYGTIENSKNGLSLANLKKFAAAIPNLNLRWFITGEGETGLSEKSEYEISELSKVSEEKTKYIPQTPPNTEGVSEMELLKKQVELLMIEMKRLEMKHDILEKEVRKKK